MGKYYCDYCDVFLTHDSQSVRKAHNSGRNHVQNVIDYYNGLGHNQAQSLIDQITRQYEGGRGGPPGMGFGGGMGMGGPPVMRSANPPFMGGGPPPGFRPVNAYPPPFPQPNGSIPPTQQPPFYPPPINGMPPRPQFGGPGIGASPIPPAPQAQQPAGGAPQGGFTNAPPGATNGRAPMINPERMRMMGI